MNVRTEVMMTASSAKVELTDAFAESITARRFVVITFACRVGEDRTRTPLLR